MLRRALVTAIAAAVVAGCGAAQTATPVAPQTRMHSAATAKLLLDDEFDGTSLNEKLWYTCYTWAAPGQRCTNGGNLELEWYEAGNVSLSGGAVHLTARNHPSTTTHPFTSGMIQTGGTPSSPATFAFRYGYAEIRARLPRGAGMWPAFWLVNANRQWPPEIDIMEFQGVDPKTDYCTIHWSNHGVHEQNGSAIATGVDLWAGYHTYAVDWEANAVTWYFDGKAVKRFAQSRWIPNKPMIVILNLAIGGWQPGQLTPQPSEFPASFDIDYIRVWNKNPDDTAPAPKAQS